MKTLPLFAVLALALGATSGLRAAEPEKATQAEQPDRQGQASVQQKQQQLEQQFAEQLSGATLVGHYTVTGGGQPSPKEDRYTISKVSKLKDEVWLFQVRIQYGDHDLTLPLPLRVVWAGDTPVITLDKVPVPGLGTFTARVLIHNNEYAGTWGAADHGGHLFGRIEAAKKETAPKEKK